MFVLEPVSEASFDYRAREYCLLFPISFQRVFIVRKPGRKFPGAKGTWSFRMISLKCPSEVQPINRNCG